MEKEIFMGLDAGTKSVGWAITDNHYRLVKKNGKSLWGVYMFDEAKTQKERRTRRSSARRLKRRKERIALLQDLFEEETFKVDPFFFKKINSSYCKIEDKDSKLKYNLFTDNKFTDVDFYNLYPTIYHLRKFLLETNEKADIRFIYLAFHHMVKYRGNFTFEGQEFNVEKLELLNYFKDLNELISEDLNKFSLDSLSNEDLFDAFLNNKGITKTKEALNNLLGIKKEKNLVSIISLICGGIVKVNDLFEDDQYKELDKLSFNNPKIDEFISNLETVLEDDIELIYKCKAIYDTIILKRLLGSQPYLSYAMVDKFDKHAKDLSALKLYVIQNHKNLYNDIFRDASIENNYPNYIGSNLVDNSKTTLKHAKVEDFYAFLRKRLGITPNKNKYFDSILLDMENNSFLPKLNTTDNGVFPYQLNEIEMKSILQKQSKFYPFFLEEDNYGTIMEKIVSILTFKIPYYVGPLNRNSKFAWIERKEEKIYPWNFKEVVDIEKTAQEFINRMKNHCTYMYDCTTLPKNSLIYSRFEVLNEINKINVNGMPISYKDKQALINELFLKNKKVTIKQIKTFFKSLYEENVIITSGNDNKNIEEIKSNLSSWISFKNIFKEDFESKFDMIEKIIEEITIFEDKSILSRRLKDVYHLPKDIGNIIKGFSYKGFGRLSQDLLVKLKTTIIDEMGEAHDKSIMDLLEETNQNFIEIIYNTNYSFKEQLYNISTNKVNYELVDSLPISPAIKRGIWSTIKIVDEVEKILKHPIDKFFIECTRGNGKKGETSSRKKKIIETFKTIDKVLREYDVLSKEEFNELKGKLEQYDDRKLRAKKLYLYFTQLGRCMYSNEPINIEQLFSDFYDIDHIIPQSLVKDDSLDNMVLVKSSLNRQKQDIYPIQSEIINESARKLWVVLKKSELISNNKYDKLIRKNELTSEELVQFINRQLVFTNQIVKVVANLLQTRNKNCKVIWSKASNVSAFREKFDIPKCREINDLHHAHDAYLNVVVGNVFNSKYGFEMNIKRFEQLKNNRISFKLDKIYDYSIKNGNNLLAWEPNKTIIDVKKELSKVEVLTSYMMTKKKGAFYKETIYSPSPDEKEKLIPLKNSGPLSDCTKYGGYNNVEFSHYCVVRHLKKGKEQYLFVALPILVSKKCLEDKLNYIESTYKVTNPVIVLDNIRQNMILLQNGFEYRIRGEFDRVINVQSYWSMDNTRYIKQILKASELDLAEDITEYILHKSKNKIALISKEKNLELYNYIIKKFMSKPYDKCAMLNNLAEKLKDVKGIFETLSLKNQCIILKNILNAQTCKASRGDLTLLKGSKDTGRIRLSTNLSYGTKIITKSITGYYEKVIFEI